MVLSVSCVMVFPCTFTCSFKFLIVGGNDLNSLAAKQTSQYICEGLERAIEALNEAAALRERFGMNTANNRRVAAAVAAAVCNQISLVFDLFSIELFFNSTEILVGSWSPVIFHWLFCIKYQ